jgi:hypothetical protein
VLHRPTDSYFAGRRSRLGWDARSPSTRATEQVAGSAPRAWRGKRALSSEGRVMCRISRDPTRYSRSVHVLEVILAWLKTELRWIWGASEIAVQFGDSPENSERERR